MIARTLARLIPARYRDEILADLESRHRGVALWLAILHSARDAHRQMRVGPREPWGHGLGADLRSVWRTAAARPVASLSIVVILAGAIGLNTAIASLVQGVVREPLPFADADRVQFIWNVNAAGAKEPLAPARALDLAGRVASIERAALIAHLSMTVSGRDTTERWYGTSVSASFFDVLQATPLLGRTFTAADADRDVVVLSHRQWRDQFNGSASVIGQSVVMNGRPRTVIGVMPASFYWPSTVPTVSAENPPLFWACAPPPDVPERAVPGTGDGRMDRTTGYLRLVTRLKEGHAVSRAQQELDGVVAELAREHPATDEGKGATLVDARTQLLGPVRQPLWIMLLASGLVILAACVNVGSLLVVRQATRQREFAVRTALGASRARLLRLVTVECAAFASVSGAAGVALAWLTMPALVSVAPPSVGRLDAVGLSVPVLLWTAAITLGVAVLLGVLTMVALRRESVAYTLRGSDLATSTGRLRSLLVAAEVALAVALLVGATLFAQSLWRLQHVDVGLDPDGLVTFNLMLSGDSAGSQAEQREFYGAVLDRIRALPGVQQASGAVTLPIGGDDFGTSVYPDGRPLPPQGQQVRIGYQLIWDGWFTTLGTPLRSGRDFDAHDDMDGPRVAIVNESLAASLWPGDAAVGKYVRLSRNPAAPAIEIIGVAADVHHRGPGEPPRPEIFLPYRQQSMSLMAVAVRAAGDPMALVPAIRRAVADVDATQAVSGVATMRSHLDRAYGRGRFLAALTMLFGVAAALLTVVGVFGVTSHVVSQRMREFGVRAALGAAPPRLVAEVIRSGLTPIWMGMVAGLMLAAWGHQAAQSLLFGASRFEPVAYALAAGAIVLTGMCALLAPALRAARVDPVIALRD